MAIFVNSAAFENWMSPSNYSSAAAVIVGGEASGVVIVGVQLWMVQLVAIVVVMVLWGFEGVSGKTLVRFQLMEREWVGLLMVVEDYV